MIKGKIDSFGLIFLYVLGCLHDCLLSNRAISKLCYANGI
jgi:hypothetical protein